MKNLAPRLYKRNRKLPLRSLLTLFTILLCTTISGASIQETQERVVFEKACTLEGEIGLKAELVAPKTTKEVRTRPTKGADGGTSEHIIERDASGEVISKTHRVTTDGKVVHQHQDHVGKHGGERHFPDEWKENPTINAPEHKTRPSNWHSITDDD